MDKFDVLLTVMLSGYGLILSLILILWRKIEKVEEKLIKIEHDLIEIKTILRMKECCMIQDNRQNKKVEGEKS